MISESNFPGISGKIPGLIFWPQVASLTFSELGECKSTE